VALSTAYSESGSVMVEVRDTGIGIPPEDLATVFDQFSRAGNAHLSAEIGTGLGLPIVRGLMALHGGDLRIESKPGVGTAVTIEFPATRILAVAAQPDASDRGSPARNLGGIAQRFQAPAQIHDPASLRCRDDAIG
jgi:signal transduction histidine kinase